MKRDLFIDIGVGLAMGNAISAALDLLVQHPNTAVFNVLAGLIALACIPTRKGAA